MVIGSWSESDLEQFKEEFQDAVNRIWNGQLWLRHSGSMTYQHRLGTLHHWNVKCDVSLQFVDDPDAAQLRVLMLYEPTGPKAWRFRASCSLGGSSRPPGPRSWFRIGNNPIDMRLTSSAAREDVDRRLVASDATDPDGKHTFTQSTVGHEFGHYLGLHHACASDGALNASEQYCALGTIWQQESLMAAGGDIRSAHAWPWKNRLADHNYLADRTWRGLARPPPRHDG